MSEPNEPTTMERAHLAAIDALSGVIEVVHAAWHALDDCENNEDGEGAKIMQMDFDALHKALLNVFPDWGAHPDLTALRDALTPPPAEKAHSKVLARQWLRQRFPHGSPFAQDDLAESLAALLDSVCPAEARQPWAPTRERVDALVATYRRQVIAFAMDCGPSPTIELTDEIMALSPQVTPPAEQMGEPEKLTYDKTNCCRCGHDITGQPFRATNDFDKRICLACQPRGIELSYPIPHEHRDRYRDTPEASPTATENGGT